MSDSFVLKGGEDHEWRAATVLEIWNGLRDKRHQVIEGTPEPRLVEQQCAPISRYIQNISRCRDAHFDDEKLFVLSLPNVVATSHCGSTVVISLMTSGRFLSISIVLLSNLWENDMIKISLTNKEQKDRCGEERVIRITNVRSRSFGC